jgi:N-acetylmuramoyl-L-alanine amidase
MRTALLALSFAGWLLLSANARQGASIESRSAPAQKPPTAASTFLVMIDAGHGGSDAGARITPSLAEKDITLSLARKLRGELQSRHVDVKLLRDSDSDLTLDQRAVAANLARPAIFLTLHAEPGRTLRIYTAALPAPPIGPAERSGFLPWQSAQAAYANGSRTLSTAVSDALAKHNISAQVRPAFLEPLHSIAAASVAIEVPANRRGITIAEDQLLAGLADAIAARRGNEGPR